MTRRFLTFAAAAALAIFPKISVAQTATKIDSVIAPAESPARQIPTAAEIITPHITDSKVVEFPCFKSAQEWSCDWVLPTWNVQMGSHTIDLGPTKHAFWLAVATGLMLLFLVISARAHHRSTDSVGRPVGTPAALEGVVLYLRNEVYLPALGGHGGERYFPFVLALLFFILPCNLIGLLPWGSTPTGNVGVTGTLAIVTFVMIEVAGMRALGAGYFNTIVYWPHDMGLGLKLPLTFIMTPIEIIGKFTKPFALTIRLFANMIAGHVIILSLILVVFTLGVKVAVFPVGMAVGIMLLEVMVAGIQAFIFSLLAAVFIGQIRTAHH